MPVTSPVLMSIDAIDGFDEYQLPPTSEDVNVDTPPTQVVLKPDIVMPAPEITLINAVV